MYPQLKAGYMTANQPSLLITPFHPTQNRGRTIYGVSRKKGAMNGGIQAPPVAAMHAQAITSMSSPTAPRSVNPSG